MVEVSTSVLSVKKENAMKTFYDLEVSKTNFFHIDVMDGKFVENDTRELMKDYALSIKHISNTPLDVHLMVENIKEAIYDYIDLFPDRISFHIEAIKDKEEFLDIAKLLRENNIKIGIAVNPETDIKKIYDILEYVHQVIVMTVNPGKGGQTLIKNMVKKIEILSQYLKLNNLDIDIEADGGINNETKDEVIKAGANILASGKYIIDSDNMEEAIKCLKS